MLGKTANGLYWMYRYMERAENAARLIETGQRIALTRLNQTDEEWVSVLQSADCLAGFNKHHDEITRDLAVDWMLRSKDESVLCCLERQLGPPKCPFGPDRHHGRGLGSREFGLHVVEKGAGAQGL